MGFLKNLFSNKPNRLVGGKSYKRSLSDYFNLVLGNGTDVGVTEKNAINIATVYACVNYRSRTFSTLPLNTYKRTDNGNKVDYEHDQYFLLKEEPHPLYSINTFLFAMKAAELLWGNGYAFITRRNGRPIKYEFVHPTLVEVEKIGDTIFYTRTDLKKTVRQSEVIHLKGFTKDGIIGISAIQAAKQALIGAANADKLMSNLMKNGSFTDKYISLPEFFDDDAFKRLQDSWADKYGGLANTGKPILLEGGATLSTIGMPLVDMQFLENTKKQKQDIAMIFSVPLTKLGEMENANNSNMVEDNVAFVTDTLRPDAVNLERELNRKIFRLKERGTHYTKLELTALLRGTPKQRAEWYRTLSNLGAISINEIRSLEDMNPVEGGDTHFIQVNQIPIEKADEYADAIIKKGEVKQETKKEIKVSEEIIKEVSLNGFSHG